MSLEIVSLVINVRLWAVKYLNILIEKKLVVLDFLVFVWIDIISGKKSICVWQIIFGFIRCNNSGIRLKYIYCKHEIHPLCEIIFNEFLIATLNLFPENVFHALVALYYVVLCVKNSFNYFSYGKIFVYEHIEKT